jgi:hypothetical protein
MGGSPARRARLVGHAVPQPKAHRKTLVEQAKRTQRRTCSPTKVLCTEIPQRLGYRMGGFESPKDVVEVVLVPVTLAVLALVWPSIQGYWRRRRFRDLILRELEEIAPYPQQLCRDTESRADWVKHMKTGLLHRRIFAEPSANRDFILSLDPDVAYLVSQLWAAVDDGDDQQFLHYLCKLEKQGLVPKSKEKPEEPRMEEKREEPPKPSILKQWRELLAKDEEPHHSD